MLEYKGGIPYRIGDGVRGMNRPMKSVSEISRRATHILLKEMGVVDTIRFLNQFSVGRGDYTKERNNWLDDMSMDDAIAEIKAEKSKTRQNR